MLFRCEMFCVINFTPNVRQLGDEHIKRESSFSCVSAYRNRKSQFILRPPLESYGGCIVRKIMSALWSWEQCYLKSQINPCCWRKLVSNNVSLNKTAVHLRAKRNWNFLTNIWSLGLPGHNSFKKELLRDAEQNLKFTCNSCLCFFGWSIFSFFLIILDTFLPVFSPFICFSAQLFIESRIINLLQSPLMDWVEFFNLCSAFWNDNKPPLIVLSNSWTSYCIFLWFNMDVFMALAHKRCHLIKGSQKTKQVLTPFSSFWKPRFLWRELKSPRLQSKSWERC